MSLKKTRFIKGIILAPDSVALDNVEGEIKVDSTSGKIQVTLKDGANPSASREVVTNSQSQTLTNKTIDTPVIDGTVSGTALETDLSSSAASDKLVTASAVKTYVDSSLGEKDEADEIIYSNAVSGLAATNVQDAIDEVESRLGTAEGSLSGHISQATDAHDASAISSVPSGNLAADDVQAALNELQSDIDDRALDSVLTAHTSSSIQHGVTSDLVGKDDNQILTTKTIDADNNIISNLETDNLKSGVLNTSTSLSGASDIQIPSALAVKSYADSIPSSIIVSQTSFTIANNQTLPANITGLVFDPALFRAVELKYSIYRQTDTALSAKAQMGQLRFVYNTQAATWFISDDFAGQDAGVEFSINSATGQIRYISSDISGSNYVGTLKYSLVKTFGV